MIESLPGWSWDLDKSRWFEAFEKLKEYVGGNKDIKVVPKTKSRDGFSIGKWMNLQRTNKDSLLSRQKKLMESLPEWSWDKVDIPLR